MDGKCLIISNSKLRPLALALGATLLSHSKGKFSEYYIGNEKQRPVNLPATTIAVKEEWLLSAAENYLLPPSGSYEMSYRSIVP